jgi:hypothetical protein
MRSTVKGIYLTEDDVFRTCVECNRIFDLFNEVDVEEYYYGHDCETLEGYVVWEVK